jgi:hypothetical protein
VGQKLDLLGRVAFVARLVPREHLGDDVDAAFPRVDHLVQQAQRPGDRVGRRHVLLQRGQHGRAFLDEHLEDPLLLLLVLDRLVVHHAEALHQAVERLIRAVVA